ncbi:MAG: hypothetical protein NZ561_09740, partial [Phycisphaerae bacterium]|nr:hypothetical protein [Phycisphaerae bacterium]
MIVFRCHCSQEISVADEEAGGLIQCPRCGRLNDIPTLSDLQNLDPEGGFRISSPDSPEEPDRLRRLTEAFTRERFDESGRAIDLRPTLDDVRKAGVEEIPLSTPESELPGTPKYDPITGELIEAIRLKPDPQPARDPATIPVATPVLTYAVRPEPAGPGPLAIGLRMFQPQNLLVIVIIFLVHLILQVTLIPVIGGLLFFAFVPAGIMLMLAAHYGKVVQETGPGDLDELPRPLGSVSFQEDFWDPLAGICTAFVFAYAPLGITLLAMPDSQHKLVAVAITGLWGAMIFPAALLTSMTSGTIYNMRPDRVISVMIQCGRGYLVPLVLLLIGPIVYFLGIWGLMLSMYNLLVRNLLRFQGM